MAIDTFDTHKSTASWLGDSQPFPGFVKPGATYEQNTDGGPHHSSDDQTAINTLDEWPDPRITYSKDYIAWLVSECVKQADITPQMITFLTTRRGQEAFRAAVLDGISSYGVRELITNYFSTKEGEEYVYELFANNPRVIRHVSRAADNRTNEYLKQNLEAEIEKILAKKGVVGQRFKWLWGVFGMIGGIVFATLFNWIFNPSAGGMGVFNLELLVAHVWERYGLWIVSITGFSVIFSVIYAAIVGMFSRSTGRHRPEVLERSQNQESSVS
jgi:hypothetical protein